MAEFRLPGALQPGLGLHRRMAGEGRATCFRRRTCASRCEFDGEARRARLWKRCSDAGRAWLSSLPLLRSSERKRRSCRPASGRRATTPASRSNRSEQIQYTIFSIKDPERLVLDLETNDLPPALAELHTKVAADDPVHPGPARGAQPARRRAPGARPQGRSEAADLHPAADRRVRPPPGARHPSRWWRSIRWPRCSKRPSKRPRPGRQARRRAPRHHRHRRRARRRGSGRASAGAARARRTSR